MQVVHICDLTKVYSRSRVRRGSSATALDRVSLTIGRGKMGAGSRTCARMQRQDSRAGEKLEVECRGPC